MIALIRDGAVVATILDADLAPALGGGMTVELPPEMKTIAMAGGKLAWDAATQTFAEIEPEPVLNGTGVWNLFTAAEKTAICLSAIPEVEALVKALPFVATLRRSDVWHQQGVALLAGLGFITAERAARVAAMLPPA